jgi:serine protease inhibitor
MKKPFNHPAVFLAMLFFFCGMGSCQKDNTTPDNAPKEIQLSASQQLLLEESKGFAFDLFLEVAAHAEEHENVFMSPLSVSLALAMAYNGAGGTTREAMHATMQLPQLSTDEINKSWQQLTNDLLMVDPKVVMNIANSIWYQQGFEVQPPFIEANQTFYDAEVRELDFGRPDAIEIINGWVADKTNNLIEEIVERVTRQTVMILLNAIYFKADWTYAFNKEETTALPFYMEHDAQKLVPVMQAGNSFRHYENDLFAVAELPYGRGNYSMLVFLPQHDITVNEVVAALDNQLWEEVTAGLSEPKKLHIQLPRFRFAFKQTLNDALISMGMGVAFSPSQADFSGINPHEQLYISEVIHKAFVDVNEEGTEAAAVTAVVIERTSAGPDNPIPFVVNRPFLFCIRETTTNTVVFAGRIMEPMEE